MKHHAKVGLTIMVVLTLAFADCQANPRVLAAPHGNIDVDGVWGIPEQGTDREGANFDRWATGPGGRPSAVSHSDPAIQNQATTLITIEDTQYRLEIVGFADCQSPGFPNKILYTHEMAADQADLYV